MHAHSAARLLPADLPTCTDIAGPTWPSASSPSCTSDSCCRRPPRAASAAASASTSGARGSPSCTSAAGMAASVSSSF